ncbi:hypothetical protein [Coraliomargarita parva]|uniref:hypothetical protein n=1 Tax=Coraliomargarita parva TaxID=3014050 RepID=UPI0022B2EF24|nr:hypothetical protein [Coraliomargarita parva]
MKLLLIPFLMTIAALTANAHCGMCGTGDAEHKAEAKMEKKACPEGCEKPCCVKKDAVEAEKKVCPAGCEKPCCANKEKAEGMSSDKPVKAACCPIKAS